jgi:hypothetical protein
LFFIVIKINFIHLNKVLHFSIWFCSNGFDFYFAVLNNQFLFGYIRATHENDFIILEIWCFISFKGFNLLILLIERIVVTFYGLLNRLVWRGISFHYKLIVLINYCIVKEVYIISVWGLRILKHSYAISQNLRCLHQILILTLDSVIILLFMIYLLNIVLLWLF